MGHSSARCEAMTTNLLKALYLGQELTEEELTDIPYPRLEVHWHVMYKQVELGGFAGMCLIGPLIGAVRGRSVTAAWSAAKTLRVDRYADLFSLGGLGVALATKTSIWTGLIAGMNVGIVAAAAQNIRDKSRTKILGKIFIMPILLR